MSPAAGLPAAVMAYGAAALLYAAAPRVGWGRRGATALFGLGFALVIGLIAHGWVIVQRPPFKTLYESLLLLVFFSSAIHLGVEWLTSQRGLGAGVSVTLAGALGYAALHRDLETIRLPPALQSPWFVPHVLTYFAGYAALLLAALAGAVTLARPAPSALAAESRADLLHWLLMSGYVLLSAGLVCGALWARQAWGAYWGWDPKENWALISWLTYTLYFHLRRLRGFDDRAAAWFAAGAFVIVVFTYLGIAWLPTGDASAHVYQ